MSFGGALFSSSPDELADQNAWRTPPSVWAPLFDHFNFGLDAAADVRNALCERWLGLGSPIWGDALTCRWVDCLERPSLDVWNNPPYGRGVGRWVTHAAEQARDCRVVQLIFTRSDTLWWHEVALPEASEIVHIRGRIPFLGPDGELARDKKGRPLSAPAPSALLIFQPGDHKLRISSWCPGTPFYDRARC